MGLSMWPLLPSPTLAPHCHTAPLSPPSRPSRLSPLRLRLRPRRSSHTLHQLSTTTPQLLSQLPSQLPRPTPRPSPWESRGTLSPLITWPDFPESLPLWPQLLLNLRPLLRLNSSTSTY